MARFWPRIVHLLGGVYGVGPLSFWITDQGAGVSWRLVVIQQWNVQSVLVPPGG